MMPSTTHLGPLRLGDVRIDFPVALAPMSGYSDWPSRVIARRMGAGFTLCEVLLDQFGETQSRLSRAQCDPGIAKALELLPKAKELADNTRKVIAAGQTKKPTP